MRPPVDSHIIITKFRNSEGGWGAKVVAHGEGTELNGTWVKVLFGPPVLFNGSYSEAVSYSYAVLGESAVFYRCSRNELLIAQTQYALTGRVSRANRNEGDQP